MITTLNRTKSFKLLTPLCTHQTHYTGCYTVSLKCNTTSFPHRFPNSAVLLCHCTVRTHSAVDLPICRRWVLSEPSSWNLCFDSSIRIISLISIYGIQGFFYGSVFFPASGSRSGVSEMTHTKKKKTASQFAPSFLVSWAGVSLLSTLNTIELTYY